MLAWAFGAPTDSSNVSILSCNSATSAAEALAPEPLDEEPEGTPVTVLPKYLPIDKRCVVVAAVPDEALPELFVETKRVPAGETRNEPARVGVTARVEVEAADVPSYVPVPPKLRTEAAAIALVVKPAHKTHKTDIVEILKLCFFMVSLSISTILSYLRIGVNSLLR